MRGKNCQLLGRCGSCRHWSSAANEARTLYALAQYTDPNASYEESLREAKHKLSLDLLDPKTAEDRGWCKAATALETDRPPMLAVHLNSGNVGDLITSRDFGCVYHRPLPMPDTKNDPDPHPIFSFRTAIEGLGDSAGTESIVLSYLPHGTALDPNQKLSPLHPDHPLNPRNPLNLAYNLVPAHAAWRQNSDIFCKLALPSSYGDGSLGQLVRSQGASPLMREQKLPSTIRRSENPALPKPKST